MELCERNQTNFKCCHTEEVTAKTVTEPEEELLAEECRYLNKFCFTLNGFRRLKICRGKLLSSNFDNDLKQ